MTKCGKTLAELFASHWTSYTFSVRCRETQIYVLEITSNHLLISMTTNSPLKNKSGQWRKKNTKNWKEKGVSQSHSSYNLPPYRLVPNQLLDYTKCGILCHHLKTHSKALLLSNKAKEKNKTTVTESHGVEQKKVCRYQLKKSHLPTAH